MNFNDRSFSVQPPANKTEDRTNAKKAFISTIKSKVESTTGLKLLPVYDEEKKHKTRGLILANQMDRSEDSSNLTVRSMVAFQPYELEYLRLLFDAIMKNPMRELQQNAALNLSKKVKKKKVTLSQSETTIEKFIEYKWLIYSKVKDIRLSTRFIYEMEPFLNNEYRNLNLNCSYCRKIVIRSVICPNKKCDSQFHVYCAASLTHQCFKCEEGLPSRRKLLKSSAGRKRRKSSIE